MRDAGVDIAVDLMGFTEGARMGIFAHRPAPAQVSYLGYAATTGAPYMDYILADDVVIPVGMDIYYDECVVKLPHCFLPTDDRRPVGVTPTRHAVGLPARAFVFCAFSKAHKITPAMFGIWLRLMREVPDSVLWLSDMGAPARDNLGHAAEGAGIPQGPVGVRTEGSGQHRPFGAFGACGFVSRHPAVQRSFHYVRYAVGRRFRC